MTILTILTYPDVRLNKIAKPVVAFDVRLQQLTTHMLETMYDAKGVGLAATQVDVHERIIVIDISDERNEPRIIINPRVVWQSEERVMGDEGCLSVPGFSDDVERAKEIHIEHEDAMGVTHKIEADGLLSVCIQHEMDHLIGKVYVSYLSPLKRSRIKKKLIKQAKEEATS